MWLFISSILQTNKLGGDKYGKRKEEQEEQGRRSRNSTSRFGIRKGGRRLRRGKEIQTDQDRADSSRTSQERSQRRKLFDSSRGTRWIRVHKSYQGTANPSRLAHNQRLRDSQDCGQTSQGRQGHRGQVQAHLALETQERLAEFLHTLGPSPRPKRKVKFKLEYCQALLRYLNRHFYP